MDEHVPTVNRIVVVVDPKEPYLRWARSLDDDDFGIDTVPRENLT